MIKRRKRKPLETMANNRERKIVQRKEMVRKVVASIVKETVHPVPLVMATVEVMTMVKIKMTM
ncbi:MAG: hypothetical protein ACR2PT_23040 [Endozoicomonas sp.]